MKQFNTSTLRISLLLTIILVFAVCAQAQQTAPSTEHSMSPQLRTTLHTSPAAITNSAIPAENPPAEKASPNTNTANAAQSSAPASSKPISTKPRVEEAPALYTSLSAPSSNNKGAGNSQKATDNSMAKPAIQNNNASSQK